MKLSASFLSMDKLERMQELTNTNIDYIHVDIMDGIFVSNKTLTKDDFTKINYYINKPLDIHLMVSDVKKYIDDFKVFNPKFITFHKEAVDDVIGAINYLNNLNIKVGLSIKPHTNVEEIIPYLPYLDLVLIMSVEPGAGGQEFINDSTIKIDQLKQLREQYNYKYLIEIDGGINNETANLCKNADILVIGSYITKSDNYNIQVDNIKNIFNA